MIPAAGGTPPSFDGLGGEEISDRLVEEMYKVYHGLTPVPFCDASAKQFIDEGRRAFTASNLDETGMLARENEAYLFPWLGTRRQTTLCHWLNTYDGIKAECEGVTIRANATRNELLQALSEMANSPTPDPMSLAKKSK